MSSNIKHVKSLTKKASATAAASSTSKPPMAISAANNQIDKKRTFESAFFEVAFSWAYQPRGGKAITGFIGLQIGKEGDIILEFSPDTAGQALQAKLTSFFGKDVKHQNFYYVEQNNDKKKKSYIRYQGDLQKIDVSLKSDRPAYKYILDTLGTTLDVLFLRKLYIEYRKVANIKATQTRVLYHLEQSLVAENSKALLTLEKQLSDAKKQIEELKSELSASCPSGPGGPTPSAMAYGFSAASSAAASSKEDVSTTPKPSNATSLSSSS